MTQQDTPVWGYEPNAAWTAPHPAPPARRGTLRLVVKVVVVLLAIGTVLTLVLAALGAYALRDKEMVPLHTPLRVGSAPRMSSPLALDIERDMVSGMSSRQRPQAGVYGKGSTPQYFLVAAYSLEETGRDVLDDFVDGVREDLSRVKMTAPKKLAGDLWCSRLTSRELSGVACAWTGTRSNGLVFGVGKKDLPAHAKVTAKARAEVDGA